MTRTRTHRWWVVAVLTFALLALGILTTARSIVVLSLPGVVFLTFARATDTPSATLEIDRELTPPDPAPGETVDVDVTVRNHGDEAIPDVRLVDGVPAALEVTDGTARSAGRLRPGAELSLTYAVEAIPGQHAFDPATALVRGYGGATERAMTVEADEEIRITCTPTLTGVPLEAQTTLLTGDIPTGEGGAGLAFHGVRDYVRGDPLSRVNWPRLAKTGDLTTVQFQRERAATVVVVLDQRAAAYYARTPADRHAAMSCVSAADRILSTLLQGGDRVGLAAFDDEFVWLTPGVGTAHRAKLGYTLATEEAFRYDPPAVPELTIDPDHPPVDLDPLLARLPADAQVVFLTPLLDDGVTDACLRLDARGHATTVVSPNVTTDGSPGRRAARFQRRIRLRRLRQAGLRTVDWPVGVPLTTALERGRRHR